MKSANFAKCRAILAFLVVLFALSAQPATAETLIYNNSTLSGPYYPMDPGVEAVDYGTSSGGNVVKFTIGYSTGQSNPGTITIRFYYGVDGSTNPDDATYLKTFNISGLSGPGTYYRDYSIGAQDQFNLPSGYFGYSYEVTTPSTGPVLAFGGTGNEDEFWEWIADAFWGLVWFGGSPPNPYAGFYMKVYTAAPVQEDPNECDITGYKFDDINANGTWDQGEPNMSGWEIYLDLNDNGQRDTAEPNVFTGHGGYYEFADLSAPAVYIVAETMKPGWTQTLPGGDGTYTIIAEPNHVYADTNFGNSLISGYCTALGGCGGYISGVQVGTINNAGTGCDGYADYTILSSAMDKGSSYPITVTHGLSFATDYCGVWVDWNRDFDFDDADETIYVYDVPSKSPYVAIITPPQDALLGDTRMRVRIWDSGPAGPCGDKDHGEVEDYTITVTDDGGCSATQYGGGCGTEAQPYLIYTAEHMQAIGASPWDWDKHFKLVADIDIGGYTGDSFNTIGYYIPFSIQLPFTGVFDGNNNKILNFTYYSAEKIEMGLFGVIRDANAEIKNLTLVDPNFYVGTGYDLGLVVGWLDEGTVSNCHIEGGSISGSAEVGGLVGLLGYLQGDGASMINCSSSATVSRGNFIGGLVGKSDQTGIISNCYSIGSVSGYMTVGGLVGFNRGPITNCYSISSVLGLSDDIGGLVGFNQSATISKSYSAGEVTGAGDVGGFVGWNFSGTIVDSFWDIDTSDQNNGVGSGSSAGVTGKTTEQMQTETTFTDAGWDFTTPVWQMCECGDYPRLQWEVIKYGGGRGAAADPYLICTAEQMNEIGTDWESWDKHLKLTADIDLGGYTGDSFNIIGAPTSRFTGVFDGNGKRIFNFTYTSVFPNIHLIGVFRHLDGENAVIKDLGLVNPNVNSVTGNEVGALVGRLNVSGSGLISGCYVEGGSVSGGSTVGGLVGLVENGTVSNCYATCDVSGNNDNVGGLVGENDDDVTISNSYAKGTVSGEDGIGGFVGRNHGMLSDCYATGDVTGNYDVGGLTGLEFETIIGCYSTGSVTGIDNVGGLIGSLIGSGTVTNCYSSGSVFGSESVGGLVGEDNFRPISNCYSVGKVTGSGSDVGGLIGYTGGTITDCFWDNDINPTLTGIGNMTDPVGVIGESTANMQTESTFTDAGWDFITPVWKICEGTNYSRLAWQEQVLGDFICPDGVEMNDLIVLCEQWLLPVLSADIAGSERDGFVDLSDWAVFANAWQSTSEPPSANWNPKCDIAPDGGDGIVDMGDLIVFVNQWLQLSAYCADIAPEPDGDGIVNMPDFAAFAEHWLEDIE